MPITAERLPVSARRRAHAPVVAIAIAIAVGVALLLCACAGSARAAAASWRWPVRGGVLDAFRVGANPYAAGQHRGVDLGGRPGEAVRAACAGRVRFAGRVARSGLVVSVLCPPLVATYVHLGTVRVARGGHVVAGQQIGTIGSAGSADEPRPHVHLGARDARTGRYIDPLRLLADDPGAPVDAPVALRPIHGLGPAPGGPGSAPARAHRRTPSGRPAVPRTGAGAIPRTGADAIPRTGVEAIPRTGVEVFPRAARAPDAAVPTLAWVGLGLVAAGLPMGGLVTLRRRRAARQTAAIAAEQA
jgi:Peptidase family M23